MALILNLDTATETGSVCLAKDGTAVRTMINSRQKDHAGVVTSFIETLLRELGVSPTSFDAIAISGGPGSYTGLRVAAATAKGLCYAWNRPLIAINTLEMMANGMRMKGVEEALFCPMIDARRQEVFTAVYDQALTPVIPPEALVLDPESFRDLLSASRVCFFGSGSIKWQNILPPSGNAVFGEYQPDASHLASLAEAAFTEKKFEDPAYFEPLYLKSFYTSQSNDRQ